MNKQEIEKAIDVLNGNKEGFESLLKDQPDHPMRGSIEHQIDALEMAISALTQQLNNGWIPISERLPEKGEKYLVTFQGKTVDTCQFINGHFRIYREKMTHLISAWQPLPDPYKEDKDAERN